MAATADLMTDPILDRAEGVATNPAASAEDRAGNAADVAAHLDRLTARHKQLAASADDYTIGLSTDDIAAHRETMEALDRSIYRAKAIHAALTRAAQ